VILFQRCSVICCDIFYMLMCWKLIAVMDRSDFASKAINQFSNKLRLNPCLIIFTLSCLNAGLIIVDNIHFQYNSLMLGILIYSISCAFTKSYLHLTFAFSILILMKHLFITLIPVYAVFLLRTYCRIQRNNSEKFRFSIGKWAIIASKE
jgi:alpha-1,3-glucosyltransferase